MVPQSHCFSENGSDVHIGTQQLCLFVSFLKSSSATRLYWGWVPSLTFYVLPYTRQSGETMTCLSRSHYTDTDATSREQASTAGIEPRTSSPGVVAHSTDWAAAPSTQTNKKQNKTKKKQKKKTKRKTTTVQSL